MNTCKAKVLVIVPAHNEEGNLAQTIDEINTVVPHEDVVVVSDGSTDKSEEIARLKHTKVITIPFKLGIGGAFQTGLKFAQQNNYEVAIQVDADGQHNPRDVPLLIRTLLDRGVDIVIGSRDLKSKKIRTPLVRKLGIRYFSRVTNWATGNSLTDCTSGFRALSRRTIKLFAESYPVDFPDAESLILAHKAGLRMVEVPVTFRERRSGVSSLSLPRLLYYPLKETIAIARLMIQGRQISHDLS
jgi:glycosyltransferase involved in cell wall biosynthesis